MNPVENRTEQEQLNDHFNFLEELVMFVPDETFKTKDAIYILGNRTIPHRHEKR